MNSIVFNKCTCGRGIDGKCDDSHSLTPNEWECVQQEKLKKIHKIVNMSEEWCQDQDNGLTDGQICVSALKDIRRILTTNKENDEEENTAMGKR